jgi:hypothetical protein
MGSIFKDTSHDVRTVPHEIKLFFPQWFFSLVMEKDQVTLSIQSGKDRLIVLDLLSHGIDWVNSALGFLFLSLVLFSFYFCPLPYSLLGFSKNKVSVNVCPKPLVYIFIFMKILDKPSSLCLHHHLDLSPLPQCTKTPPLCPSTR